MRTAARYWKAFRSWPELAQLAAWITLFMLLGALFIPGPARAAEDEEEDGDVLQVRGQAICSADGQLLGLRLFLPAPGLVTISIPPDACKRPTVEKPAAPPPQRRPAREV